MLRKCKFRPCGGRINLLQKKYEGLRKSGDAQRLFTFQDRCSFPGSGAPLLIVPYPVYNCNHQQIQIRTGKPPPVMKTDLGHLPQAKQRELRHIVNVLYEEFETATTPSAPDGRRTGRIYKIILFGSYARGGWVDERNIGKGYQSDYDILVIVNCKEFTDVPRYWLAAEDRLMFDKAVKTPVEIIVHTLGDVNSQLKQGNYFFRDIREDGIALYEFEGTKASGNRKHALAEPGNLSSDDAYEKSKQYLEGSLPFARNFMIGFEAYVAKGLYNNAAFELHQATEHAYRALLLTLTLYSPAEHNVNKLRGLAESLDHRLIEAWPRGRKPYDRYFQLLRRAYVEARYSPHYEITREELDWLGERIARLHELAEVICEERLDALAAARS